MNDKEKIKKELSEILFELKLSKTSIEKRNELLNRKKELEDSYKHILYEEKTR